MANLYELTDYFKHVQSLIEEGGEGLDDTLESLEVAIEDKLDNIGKVMRNLEGEIQALKTEEKRLADKRKSIENNIKRLKEYSQDAMLSINTKKVKTDLFTFSVQKNPPKVEIVNEADIPDEYYIPADPKLDKDTIKELLKSNQDVPGASLVQGESLRIK